MFKVDKKILAEMRASTERASVLVGIRILMVIRHDMCYPSSGF